MSLWGCRTERGALSLLAAISALLAARPIASVRADENAPSPPVTLGTWNAPQTFTDSAGNTLHWHLFSPSRCGDERLPLVIWLHGGLASNGRASATVPVQAFYCDDHQAIARAFVLRPTTIQGENWISPSRKDRVVRNMAERPSRSLAALIELLDRVMKEQPIDPGRVYVAGASMGGFGAWDLIQRFPGRFAAALLICGGADPARAPALKDMPLWIFHSADDGTVRPEGSRAMFVALAAARNETPLEERDGIALTRRLADGRIRYTEYDSGGHKATWERALGDPEVIRWLYSHRWLTAQTTGRKEKE